MWLESMANKIHTVRQGEYLQRIARQYGFSDWRTVYNHPDNAALRKKRPNPNILHPGDKIVIPEKKAREESGSTEQRHRFQVSSDRTWLLIVFRDMQDKPLSGKAYVLDISVRAKQDATTGSDGLMEEEIPPNAERAHLYIQGKVLKLNIGHLDPVDSVTGWQARLFNLGYYTGEIDGKESYDTRSAVEEFQCDQKLKVDGIVGPATRSRLEQIHGC
jgi:hypothetical protein